MSHAQHLVWKIRGRSLTLDRTLIMGIVNVTPDSFSDGGMYVDPVKAIDRGLQLVAEGADIVDIGGESTRPGAVPVDADQEARRVLPVVTALAQQSHAPLSIDTMKASVARACLDSGASIVNDVTGLADAEMAGVVRAHGAGAVVMHMQGRPRDMQLNPQYGEIVGEVGEFFESRLQKLADAGIAPECVALDPGIGFGKRVEHNWQLIAGLANFRSCNRPIVLGVSRKTFLSKGQSPAERIPAGIAISSYVAALGNVHVIRTHDVQATRAAIDAIRQMKKYETSG